MTGNNRQSQAGRRKASQPKPQRQQRSNRRVQVQRVVQKVDNSPLMQSNSNHRQMHNEITTVRGSDFLGRASVTGTPATAGDRIRKTFPVSPSAYPGTRLSQMSNLWERFRFKKFSIRYVPSVPNTLACQLMLYQDTDPQDDPTVISDADALIQQATAQTGSQQWNFNSAKRVDLARRADKELYYTGVTKENVRFNYQGVAYLIQQSSCLNFNGEAVSDVLECGSIYVDWEVEFQTPQINPAAVTKSLPPTGGGAVLDETINIPIIAQGGMFPDPWELPAKDYARTFFIASLKWTDSSIEVPLSAELDDGSFSLLCDVKPNGFYTGAQSHLHIPANTVLKCRSQQGIGRDQTGQEYKVIIRTFR